MQGCYDFINKKVSAQKYAELCWCDKHSILGPLAWKITVSLIFCVTWSYLSESQTSQDVVIVCHLGRWIHCHCGRAWPYLLLFVGLQGWVVCAMQRRLHLAFSPRHRLWHALFIQRIKWKAATEEALLCHAELLTWACAVFCVLSVSSSVEMWILCKKIFKVFLLSGTGKFKQLLHVFLLSSFKIGGLYHCQYPDSDIVL